MISGAIFDLDATIAARDEIMSFFARRVIGFGVAAPRLKFDTNAYGRGRLTRAERDRRRQAAGV